MEAIVEVALLEYSAWLEREKLMKKPKKHDCRTHEDLVDQFLSGNNQ